MLLNSQFIIHNSPLTIFFFFLYEVELSISLIQQYWGGGVDKTLFIMLTTF